MRNAALALTHPSDRETSVGTSDNHVVTRGRFLGSNTTREVSIRIQVRTQRVQTVTNPTNHAEMFGGVHVTHKSVKLAVTFGRPSRNKSREVTDGPKQIKTRQSGCVEKFHEDFGSNGL